MKILLGREPALWLGLVTALIQLVSTFIWDISPEVQGAINAAAAAVLGFVIAAFVRHEKLVPAVTGLVQAMLALGLALGWQLSAADQSTVMAFVAAAAALWTRTQVTPKVEKRHMEPPAVRAAS